MKDPKGHGSNARGGMSVPDKHQHRIALQTLRMPDAMANVMGGPNKEQARAILRDKFGYSDKQIAKHEGDDKAAASTLAQGNPKAASAPIHSGAAGRNFPITVIGDKGHAEAQKATVNRLLRRHK